MTSVVGWLHRIPDARSSEGLLASEYVCRQPKLEVLMDKVNTVVRNVVSYLNEWNLAIVVVLSVLHVGLAYIHTRESG
jgi:hypothetical protein